jgi:PadR family transcriptional regulator PadR
MRSSQLLKGTLEIAVLGTIARAPTYGLALLQQLRGAGLPSLADASVYGALRRLEADGHIIGRLQASNQGAARKYYELTDSGREALDLGTADWRQINTALEHILERGSDS